MDMTDVKSESDLEQVIEILAKGASVIAEDCAITGDMLLQGSVVVDGAVEGSVTIDNVESILYVRQSGRINGEIRAANVYIEGTVKGTVYADKVTVAGCLIGDLYYTASLVVKDGSDIKGKIDKAAPTATEDNPADKAQGQPPRAPRPVVGQSNKPNLLRSSPPSSDPIQQSGTQS